MLAYIRAHVDGDRFFAPIAGILIGLTPFLHITGVVAIGALGLAALLGRYGGQRLLASFALPLAVATGLAAVYYLTVLATYTRSGTSAGSGRNTSSSSPAPSR